MYVTIEKLEHGLIRQHGISLTRRTATAQYQRAKAQWRERGYEILENLSGQAVVLDKTKPIGIIQVVPVK